jgi:hypothetical protein
MDGRRSHAEELDQVRLGQPLLVQQPVQMDDTQELALAVHERGHLAPRPATTTDPNPINS